MRCKNCGNENIEGAKFCSRCGKPLVNTNSNSRTVESQEGKETHVADKIPENKKK